MEYFAVIFLFLFANMPLANRKWYESKVLEVSTRSNGWLYIRTELNPNPAKCAANWPGARWQADEGSNSSSLAASIALSAKALNTNVKFSIDLESCGESGMPIMNWIQQQ